MQIFNIRVGDVVEYFEEEHKVEHKDDIGRLLLRSLVDNSLALALGTDVYFLRKEHLEREEE